MGKKRILVIVLAAAIVMSLTVGAALAEEQDGNRFMNAVKRFFGATGKTVEKEVNAVGMGVKGTTDVVTEEVKDVGALATGDGSKAKDIVVKPIMGTTEVVGETAHDVINAPIEAGQEVYGGQETK